jgi:septal ring-binding cell division protein DamX
MNALLIKCLEEHPTTIIPNFGAIMKLGNSFVYNEFLKFDDGKLIAFVATQKNISKDEGKIEVEKWSKEILNTLNIGNLYPIESVGIFTIENGKVVLKKTAELEASSNKSEKMDEEKKAEVTVIEIRPEPVIVEVPKPIENIKKEVKESDLETSSSLSAKMAIASIESFKDKNKLIEYTRGESRKTVIDALNTKLNQLNGKQQINTDVKTDPQKEVAKPEAILEVKKEEDSKEIEELIALTSSLDKVDEESITEKKEDKIKFEKNLKHNEKPIINKEEKTTEKEPSKPVEQVKTDPKPSVEIPVSTKTVQEDKALEIIAEGVTKLEKEEKKRKKKRIFLFIGLICILSGSGILGYLNKDYLMSIINGESTEVAVKKEQKKEQKEEAKSTTDVEKSDEPIEVIPEEIVEEPIVEVEEIVKETPVEAPVKDTKATPNSTNYSISGNLSGDYLVIAGSFSVEKNAQNLVEKLKSEGFSNAYIDFNSGTLIKVVSGTYTSKEEAKNAVDQLVSKGLKGFVQKK